MGNAKLVFCNVLVACQAAPFGTLANVHIHRGVRDAWICPLRMNEQLRDILNASFSS